MLLFFFNATIDVVSLIWAFYGPGVSCLLKVWSGSLECD